MKRKKKSDKRHGRALIKAILAIASVILFVLVTASAARASGLANARAIGMAGAYTSLAKGYYCPGFNPANLGLASYQMRGLQLFGAGFSIKNNSFSLDDYNTYTGARLNEQEKQELLSKIPSEGLLVSADGELAVLGFGAGQFAVTLSALGAAEVNLGRTAVELLLNGNSFADTIDLSGVYGQGYALGAINFSYGHRLYKDADRQLAAGGTIRYLKGFGYEEITEADGRVVTLESGFDGIGNLVARTASGGAGFAVDLGTTLQINRNYTVGVTIFNFLSAVSWNKNTEGHHFTFTFDSLTASGLSEDSLIVTTDTTFPVGAFTTHLPSTIKAGLAKTAGRLLWAIDWEQGFKTTAGSSSTPRLSAGGEYRLFHFLPLRAGFGMGGKQGATYACGLGLDLTLVHLDLALANFNAISGPSGKGLNFAVNTGMRF